MKHVIRTFPKRFYIGVEYEGGVVPGSSPSLGKLWSVFLSEDVKLLNQDDCVFEYIGLECYPPDFMESNVFDYYAMVRTKDKIVQDGFVSKKLPAGSYISFEIQFDNIHNDIQKVYQYIKEHEIQVHFGFDFEEYLIDQDYTKEGAVLYLSFLLEESS